MDEKENKDLRGDIKKRLMLKYKEKGVESFEDIEILEMYLYCALRGKNVEEISRELLARFKSLKGVLLADHSDLMEIDGINYTTAAMICYLKDFILRLKRESIKPIKLDTTEKLFKFCRDYSFYSTTTEEGSILYLDKKYNYVNETRLMGNKTSSLSINIQELFKTAIKNKCPNVVLIHTHPNCSPQPSGYDIYTTKHLIDILGSLEIKLVDHIIIHGEEMLSMRQSADIEGWSKSS